MRPFEPSLMGITDVAEYGEARTLDHMEALCAMARPGSVCIQLRDLRMDARQKLRFGEALAARTEPHGQWLSVNDHLHVAALLGVRAIHLGEASVATPDAREFMRCQGLEVAVSRACHQPEQVGQIDADAAVLSPVFAERKGRAALGPRGLEQAMALAAGRPDAKSCKVFALGGVTLDRISAQWSRTPFCAAVMGAAYGDRDSLHGLVSAMGLQR